MKPGWLVVVGIISGLLGGVLMIGADMQAAVAKVGAGRETPYPGTDWARAVAVGHIGLAILIIGGVLALAGVIIMAARHAPAAP